MEKQEKLISAQELAKFLQVSDSSIYRLRNSGSIPAVENSSPVRFRASEVLAACREHARVYSEGRRK